VIAALLITNLAIGIMTRAAPQLNIFAVGFPLTLAAGFVVLYLSLAHMVPVLERVLGEMLRALSGILGSGAA
jgi:flagellar biosynthesis protein FliR